MGTGILGTLTELHAGSTAVGADLARFFLVTGWVLMIAFAAGFAARVIASPSVFTASVSGVGAATWGMVSMGVLSVGAATATVVPAWTATEAPLAFHIDEVLWTIGTLIGLLSTFGFTLGLIKHRPAEPRPAWGLAIVPPMVSATTGAPFVARIGSTGGAFAFLLLLGACFTVSLTLGVVIFSAAYRHHLRAEPIPVPLSTSAWIPLGVVGQSTAAAQVLAAQAARFTSADAAHSAQTVANVYGYVMLTVAVPLVVFAIALTLRGFAQRMPFSPGWWALTFPIGTLSLGALNLAKGSGVGGYGVASDVAWVVLLCTWTLCATASVLSLRRT
ncbi:MAG: TDT family transporter [Gordonia sp. (in: high G+C Gram-positive bacteria)]